MESEKKRKAAVKAAAKAKAKAIAEGTYEEHTVSGTARGFLLGAGVSSQSLDTELDALVNSAKKSKATAKAKTTSKAKGAPKEGDQSASTSKAKEGLNFRLRAEKGRRRTLMDAKLAEANTLHKEFTDEEMCLHIKVSDCNALRKSLEGFDQSDFIKYYKDPHTGGITAEGMDLAGKCTAGVLLVGVIGDVMQSVNAKEKSTEASVGYKSVI